MKAQRGRNELEGVLRSERDRIWSFLRRMGIDGSDLPDLAQEVMITIVRRYADYEGRSALSTWIYGICLNHVRNYLRARQRDVVPSDEELGEPSPSVEGAVIARDWLDAALARLSLEQRAAFVLYEVHGFNYREVGELLGVPLGTAASRHRAAVSKLRDQAEQSKRKEEAVHERTDRATPPA